MIQNIVFDLTSKEPLGDMCVEPAPDSSVSSPTFIKEGGRGAVKPQRLLLTTLTPRSFPFRTGFPLPRSLALTSVFSVV